MTTKLSLGTTSHSHRCLVCDAQIPCDSPEDPQDCLVSALICGDCDDVEQVQGDEDFSEVHDTSNVFSLRGLPPPGPEDGAAPDLFADIFQVESVSGGLRRGEDSPMDASGDQGIADPFEDILRRERRN